MCAMDLGRPWVLRSLVIALAIVVGVIVYLAVSGDDEGGGGPPAPTEATAARILSEEELTDAASAAEFPVYWAGERDGAELELTEEGSSFLVRYLDEGDEAGAAFGGRIAIGSYALPNPRKALNTFAETPGATTTEVAGIGKVVISPEAQRNVYFVDPDNEVQVEVYAPSSRQAIGLLRTGQVQPIG